MKIIHKPFMGLMNQWDKGSAGEQVRWSDGAGTGLWHEVGEKE